MINPANYYNPFAKYNYVSKTRGVYIPKDTEPLLKTENAKSGSIYSENYDAETDILNAIEKENSEKENKGFLGVVYKFLNSSNN